MKFFIQSILIQWTLIIFIIYCIDPGQCTIGTQVKKIFTKSRLSNKNATNPANPSESSAKAPAPVSDPVPVPKPVVKKSIADVERKEIIIQKFDIFCNQLQQHRINNKQQSPSFYKPDEYLRNIPYKFKIYFLDELKYQGNITGDDARSAFIATIPKLLDEIIQHNWPYTTLYQDFELDLTSIWNILYAGFNNLTGNDDDDLNKQIRGNLNKSFQSNHEAIKMQYADKENVKRITNVSCDGDMILSLAYHLESQKYRTPGVPKKSAPIMGKNMIDKFEKVCTDRNQRCFV